MRRARTSLLSLPADAPTPTSPSLILLPGRPAGWGSLDVNALGKHLRNMEVRVDKIHVRGKGTNAGVKREWLDVSTTRLAGDEEPDGPVDNVISLTERQ